MVAAEGAGYICRNPDAFIHNYSDDSNATKKQESYHLSQVAPANAELSDLLVAALTEHIGADSLRTGTNVTAESFYSSQGRIDPNFDDDNHDISKLLVERYPSARSLEMESFWLLHLAQCSKIPIKATAAAIVLANRLTAKVVDGHRVDELERKGGLSVLEAITKVSL